LHPAQHVTKCEPGRYLFGNRGLEGISEELRWGRVPQRARVWTPGWLGYLEVPSLPLWKGEAEEMDRLGIEPKGRGWEAASWTPAPGPELKRSGVKPPRPVRSRARQELSGITTEAGEKARTMDR